MKKADLRDHMMLRFNMNAESRKYKFNIAAVVKINGSFNGFSRMVSNFSLTRLTFLGKPPHVDSNVIEVDWKPKKIKPKSLGDLLIPYIQDPPKKAGKQRRARCTFDVFFR
jgi:hypothetical protein